VLDLRPEAILATSVRKTLEECVIELLTFLNLHPTRSIVATWRLALRVVSNVNFPLPTLSGTWLTLLATLPDRRGT
jgi:hypothetical protein